MAYYSIIPIKLLATKTPLSISPILCIITLSLLVINVKSDLSFNFTTFGPHGPSLPLIGLANDATVTKGAIQLTKKAPNGNPLPHSVGQAGLIETIRIYDKTKGKVADFTTEFTFVVAEHGKLDHGDGLVFFLIPPSFRFPNKTKSGGGFLGMFTKENAFNSNEQILFVEFDTFDNDWDPFPGSEAPHIGINVGCIKSVTTGYWFLDFEGDGTIATARISYDSKALRLYVSLSYNGNRIYDTSISYGIDLTEALPEEVLIGFSAATGDSAETHDILSWSFSSNLKKN